MPWVNSRGCNPDRLVLCLQLEWSNEHSMATTVHPEDVGGFVERLLQDQNDDAGQLLQFLIAIQDRYGFVPDAALDRLSRSLHQSAAEIESVIAFYSFLQRNPALYRVYFSDNITDRLLGSDALRQRLIDGLHGNPEVTIETTSCTGLCDQGPAMLVNGRAIGRLDEQRIDRIIGLISQRVSLENWPADWFKVDDNIKRRDRQMSVDVKPGEALQRLSAEGNEWLLQQLETAALRGRGGAGFSTAKKWRLCRDSPASDHVVVCNADEGEPGTFKDRVLLSSDPHAVIEGMTLCARVIGASRGFIYLRGEYRFLLEPLQSILRQRRALGLLGKATPGDATSNFDIDIHLGAGAYICGEESALIESLEGKRGIPRVRPPFPVQAGYFSMPTVVNNVETFWSAARIALYGADWFRKAGAGQSTGTRLISISGDCDSPGVYEYPFGTRIDSILRDCGGSAAQAVQIAGAAGNLVPAEEFGRQLSFEDLPTGGSFMVFGAERELMDVLDNFAAFFRHESCGFCTPCRNGSVIVADIIRRFQAFHGSRHDLAMLAKILRLMQKSSFCGLGCSAPTAFIDAMDKLPGLFEARLASPGADPNFDLVANLSESEALLAHDGRTHG